MAGDPYRATGGSEGNSTRHRETANDAYQLGVELRWRQDQGKSTLLRHAVFHAAARHIATVMAMCRHSPPHETVEKVRLWRFHGKAPFENKGVINTGFLDSRVFRQSQSRCAADCQKRPLRSRFRWCLRKPPDTVGESTCAVTTNNTPLVTRIGFGGNPIGQPPHLMLKG